MQLLPKIKGRLARLSRSSLIGLVAVGLTFGSLAQAGPITFVFDYSGNAAGVGFLDPVLGAARQTAMTNAGLLFSDYFGTLFTNGGTINLGVTSTDDPLSNTLASAGSEQVSSGGVGFNSGEVIRTKLQTGVDLNGNGTNDGSVDVNWGSGWQLDPNVPAVDPDYDFFAAIVHEFTHALGFASSIAENGTDAFGDTAGDWVKFDSFLANKNGVSIVDGTTFVVDGPVWDAAKVGGTGNGVYFFGANAVAANGGNPVALYSPTTWQEGSSVSHLDKAIFPLDMMKPDRDVGSGEARTYSAVEIAMLTDLGYTPVPAANEVPEPGTYAMMLMGLGAIGWHARRRKS